MKMKMKQKTGEKLKKTLKSVISYLKSDSYMYSSLLSKECSDCFSPADTNRLSGTKGGMETGRNAKIEKRFLHKIVDYLKSDCYMYAPLIVCSASPEYNRALNITPPFKRSGKRRYGKKSSPRSTLVRNTLAFRREEKCLINPVGRSSSPSGSSKRFKTGKENTTWTGEGLLKIMKEGV